MIHIQNKDT